VPTWQNGLAYTKYSDNTTVTLTSGTLSATQGRAIPDVAINGDPYCGITVYYTNSSNVNTQPTTLGTSGGTPIWAGLIARQNQIAGSARGFVNATYYANPGDFRDIVSGNNYNPDSPDRGIAELLITKHRNGPTGVIKLLFKPEFTQFLNLQNRNDY
jgi:hypothetical protein